MEKVNNNTPLSEKVQPEALSDFGEKELGKFRYKDVKEAVNNVLVQLDCLFTDSAEKAFILGIFKEKFGSLVD